MTGFNDEAELVLVPTPGMGHLLSAVELAKLIIRRNNRIYVLVLVIKLPMFATMLDEFIDSQSRDNPYPTRLTFQTLPPLSEPLEPFSPTFFETLIKLNKPLVKQAVEDRTRAGSPRLSGFILDMFCSTMVDIGNDFHVPSYIFFTSGANFLSFMFHFVSLAEDEGIDIGTEASSNPDAKFNVPGFCNEIPGKVVPAVFLEEENGKSMIFDLIKRFKQSKGIIVNSYTELEANGIQALLDQFDKGSIPAIYPVGPILELNKKTRNGSHKADDEESIMKWLDDQPASSVVYLCFGSMGCFDEDQVKEMAEGLENSGHRFLWSLRKPPSEGKVGTPSEHETFVEALPEGFLDRTAQRGKIIAWAPQISILGHPSVGGFVSHCGWNSTLESLWFGVPMATWPLHAEQQINAFQLVKEMGVAVEIRMDYRRDWRRKKSSFTVTAKEIENGVRELMSMDDETKNRVREIRDNGRKALEVGGSSHNWLGRFIEDILSIAA